MPKFAQCFQGWNKARRGSISHTSGSAFNQHHAVSFLISRTTNHIERLSLLHPRSTETGLKSKKILPLRGAAHYLFVK